MVEELFGHVLDSIFSLKGITYDTIEIYAWKDEEKVTVEKLDDFNRFDDFVAMFCLSNAKLTIDGIPFQFDWFDFSCTCQNGMCCHLYFDPDNFGFNAEIKLSDGQITELKNKMMGNLGLIAQALFSLGGFK